MLYSLVHSKELIEHTPHEVEFTLWKSRLSFTELRTLFEEISDEIDRATDAPAPLFYVPQPDWQKKAYEPILTKACLRDATEARRCFAVFVWEVIRKEKNDWAFQCPNATKTLVEEVRYYRI